MRTVFEMIENFIGRGMNARTEFVGGIQMFSAATLEENAGTETETTLRQKKSMAALLCLVRNVIVISVK